MRSSTDPGVFIKSRMPSLDFFKPPNDANEEVDDDIPAMESVLYVHVVTRRSSHRKAKDKPTAKPPQVTDAPRTAPTTERGVETVDAAAESADKPSSVSERKKIPANTEAKATSLVRASRINAGTRTSKWEDTSFMPLPADQEEDDDDAEDLIADARDAIVAGRLERNPDDDVEPAEAKEVLPTPLTQDEILEEQKNDEFCQTIAATQMSRTDSCFFENDDGVLCRRHPRDPDLVQVVLPSTLRHRVLRLAHYHLLAGHPGQSRLHKRLRRTYYWPQMAADTATTVRECVSCSKNRIRLIKQVNPMRLFPPSEPLESVAMDILGPLPKSKSGSQFILVITDRFSKLTQVVPLRRIKAYDVALAFVEEWVFKCGPPKTLLSDNGSHFVSLFFQQVCQVMSVNNRFRTTYHPQTNGQAERFNRSLTAMLRCYIEHHPADWCQYFRPLCYA